MAVYTPVSGTELNAFLGGYDLGEVLSFRGITEGVENSNYFLETTTGKFILTLFEKRVAESDLPFFINLMTHLSGKGFPSPHPVADKKGQFLQALCNRPALIVSFLPGKANMLPSADHCRLAGEALARLHVAATDFPQTRANALGPAGWRSLAAACIAEADRCAPALAPFVQDELANITKHWPSNLPGGVIHADLFPDNVFFEDDAVSGVIDFYFACTDFYAYDLAVCINSWANAPEGWSSKKAAALIEGYELLRPLSDDEKSALPTMLRGAALRFLLTRLYDWLNQVEGALVTVKDPLEYRDIIAMHRTTPFSSVVGKI